jgi:pyruvate dehydrogenase E2 component (dihydrolipoamide acetyltransferase)
MATEFKLPVLGENIDSGDVVSVMVQEGDTVQANQPVVEIETDKAVIEVPVDEAGRVSKIHVKPGDTVKIGSTILTLEPAGKAAEPSGKKASSAAAKQPQKAPADQGKADAKHKAEKHPQTEEKPTQPAARQPSPPRGAKAEAEPPQARADEEAAQRDNGRSAARPPSRPAVAAAAGEDEEDRDLEPAGPAVRRLARELGVDLSRVRGTGPGGRITRDDIVAAVRQANVAPSTATVAAPAPQTTAEAAPTSAIELPGVEDRDSYGMVHRESLTKIRKTIAANMVRSHTTIPHVTNLDDADITELEKIRKASAGDYAQQGVKLTTLSFVMKAVALSLKLHPTINASLDQENGEIVYKSYINLGVAVDTERGLVVPVVRDVDRLSIPGIAAALMTIAEKARQGQLTIDDMRGGTFTISNQGSVGGTYSTPIINPPEVAILLVGRARKMAVVADDDKIVPRLMMPLSLSFDHRLVDGATASRFLNDVIGYLKSPGRLLLAP